MTGRSLKICHFSRCSAETNMLRVLISETRSLDCTALHLLVAEQRTLLTPVPHGSDATGCWSIIIATMKIFRANFRSWINLGCFIDFSYLERRNKMSPILYSQLWDWKNALLLERLWQVKILRATDTRKLFVTYSSETLSHLYGSDLGTG
jgi:hypothetical protein